MIISEAIKKLQEIQTKHGDLTVGMENVEFMHFFPVTEIEARALEKNADYFSNDDEELGAIYVGIS